MTVTLPAHTLRTLLASVIPACDTPSTMTPVLAAIRIKIDASGFIEATATNRFIVAQNSTQADTYNGAGKFLLRVSDAKALIAALPKSRTGGDAKIDITADQMTVDAASAVVTYRAQEGDYPLVERLFVNPDDHAWPEHGVGIGFMPARLVEISKCAQAINRNAAIVFSAQTSNTKPVALRIDDESAADWRGLIMPTRI